MGAQQEALIAFFHAAVWFLLAFFILLLMIVVSWIVTQYQIHDLRRQVASLAKKE